MNALKISAAAAVLSLPLLVAACSPSAPGSLPMDQSRSVSQAAHGPGALLYVADLGAKEVDYLSYPAGKKEGVLTGFYAINGVCADAKGDVFAVDGHVNDIYEFPHGGTKAIATLQDPGYYFHGCAVDPHSGDLAVAIEPVNSDPGGIAIFKHAKGKPANFTSQDTFFSSYCGYDDEGDFFLDGEDIHGMFYLAEMAKGSRGLKIVSLAQQIQAPGGVQWDGKVLAVGDQGVGYKGSTIYRFKITAGQGRLVGTTPLGGSTDVIGFAIDGDRVIGPNFGDSSSSVLYWKYPAGGEPIKTITGFIEPIAVTISE